MIGKKIIVEYVDARSIIELVYPFSIFDKNSTMKLQRRGTRKYRVCFIDVGRKSKCIGKGENNEKINRKRHQRGERTHGND